MQQNNFKVSEDRYDFLIKLLKGIKSHLEGQEVLQKEILDLEEACKYLNLSDSSIYKLTSKNEIRHYKPNGKKIYFKKEDLDGWILSKSNKLNEEELETARDNVRELFKNIG